MPSHFYDRLPPHWFTRPGLVKVSKSALQMAEAFRREIQSRTPSGDWVVGFDWADDRRVRDKANGQWRVLGPGIDVAAYERRRLPDGFIHDREGFEYLVKVPDAALKDSATPMIDTDPASPTKLILR